MPDPKTEPAVAADGSWPRLIRRVLPDYNRRAAVYWAVTVVLGLVTIVLALQTLQGLSAAQWLQVGAIVLCAAGAALVPIRVPGSRNSFALGEIFIFLLLLLHGPAAAVLAAAVEAAVATLRTSRRLSSWLASPALAALAMGAAGWSFEHLQWALAALGFSGPAPMLLALLAVAVACGLLNAALLTMIFVLKSRRGLSFQEWAARFGWVTIVFGASAAVSGLLFVSLRELGWTALLIAVPIIGGLLAALRLYFRVVDLAEDARRVRVEAAEREAAQAALHLQQMARSEQRFHSAFSHASIGMALVGADGRLQQVNSALAQLFRASAQSLEGRHVATLVARDQAWLLDERVDDVRSGRRDTFSAQMQGQRADGQEMHITLDASVFADDGESTGLQPGAVTLIVQVQDITARMLAEQRLQHIAHHDDLTDLANRGYFIEQLDAALAAASAEKGRRCAVLFLDFDRFKLINDSLGHDTGDAFLRLVAARLRHNVRPADLVARLGGDEFAILMRPIEDAAAPSRLAERLQAVLRKPMQVGSHELRTSASIGIRLSNEEACTAQDMLRDADTAMYRAKAAGKARHAIFDASMHAAVAEQMQLEGDLRVALETDSIEVLLQPIVDLQTRAINGYEALARWHHPQRGELPATRLVAVAHEAGLMTLLTQRVLERACRGLHAATEGASAGEVVNVNVSALDLCQPGFAARIAALLARHRLQPAQLVLELTEGSLMERIDGALGTLGELREIGVGLGVDDFGTGYSSLSHLSALPITMLKIDARFVARLGIDRGSAEIVRAIVQLGDTLGKQVVAEGVETEEQLAQLRDLGCRTGQGFLLGRPASAAEWAALPADGLAEVNERLLPLYARSGPGTRH